MALAVSKHILGGFPAKSTSASFPHLHTWEFAGALQDQFVVQKAYDKLRRNFRKPEA